MAFTLGGTHQGAVKDALKQLFEEAERAAIAVSYIQLSGVELLLPLIKSPPNQIRILCTDQLGITDPAAVRLLMSEGFQVHAYSSSETYHPKVYLSTTADGETRYLIGSANLSRPALLTSVEAAIDGEDNSGTMLAWFDAMFGNAQKSVPFDDARLSALAAARAARLKSNLTYRRQVAATGAEAGEEDAAAAEVLETALANLDGDPLPLNIDKAGNTVRNLGYIRRILLGEQLASAKAFGEMKQLGFMKDRQLTNLGRCAKAAGDPEGIAREWARWLKDAAPEDLTAINRTGKLNRARVIFDSFWVLPEPITTYFIEHAAAPTRRTKPLLMAIELLANTGLKFPNLSLDDVETLSLSLNNLGSLPLRAQAAIRKYMDNKGGRSWADKPVILKAWRDAQ